jgi:large subunit ribosomal protein L4
MVKALSSLVGGDSALILIPNKDSSPDVIRATNNIPDAKILLANYLNIRDLLRFDKVILPVAAIETISAYLG